jgi:hypothetical protein
MKKGKTVRSSTKTETTLAARTQKVVLMDMQVYKGAAPTCAVEGATLIR